MNIIVMFFYWSLKNKIFFIFSILFDKISNNLNEKINLNKNTIFNNKYAKDKTTIKVKDYYDDNNFDMNDVIKISRAKYKQNELFEYVETLYYLKTIVKDIDDLDKDYDKYTYDDFDLSM